MPQGLEHIRRSLQIKAPMFAVIGICALFWPKSIAVLLKLVGILVLYIGVRNILVSRQLSATDAGRASVRTTSIVAGVIGLVLFLWPGVGVDMVSWILAIAALLVAALLFFVSSRLQSSPVVSSPLQDVTSRLAQ